MKDEKHARIAWVASVFDFIVGEHDCIAICCGALHFNVKFSRALPAQQVVWALRRDILHRRGSTSTRRDAILSASGFSKLPEADRHTIGKDIQKVEFGWPIGRPHCAPLGKGLWEVRSTLDSSRIARVIFCMGDGYMILLHAFVKKTQKTPQADIDLALKRKREVT